MTAPDLAALRSLRDRVAAASGSDREIDREIHVALGLSMDDTVHCGVILNAYTGSINASTALAESQGFGWRVDQDEGCTLSNADDVFGQVKAATPPLSVCAALLSALIVQGEYDGEGE